jgi:acyl carrier protein
MQRTQATQKYELDEIARGVIGILESMTSDWDTGLSGGINLNTSLMHELTFESIDIVMLIVAIEEHFNRPNLPFEEVLLADGQFVQDLRVADLVGFLNRHLCA